MAERILTKAQAERGVMAGTATALDDARLAPLPLDYADPRRRVA